MEVQQHIEKIIENPSLLVSADATHKTGTMDGTQWERPTAVKKILEMIPELPHLTEVLVAFFKDALVTWKRFTSEFEDGGLIDKATDAEKDLAWMSPTNMPMKVFLVHFEFSCKDILMPASLNLMPKPHTIRITPRHLWTGT